MPLEVWGGEPSTSHRPEPGGGGTSLLLAISQCDISQMSRTFGARRATSCRNMKAYQQEGLSEQLTILAAWRFRWYRAFAPRALAAYYPPPRRGINSKWNEQFDACDACLNTRSAPQARAIPRKAGSPTVGNRPCPHALHSPSAHLLPAERRHRRQLAPQRLHGRPQHPIVPLHPLHIR